MQGTANGQNSSPVSSIEGTAATYVATNLVKGVATIAFDPAPPPTDAVGLARSQTEIAAIVAALGATKVGPKGSFYGCSTSSPRSCRITGADAVVTLSRPAVSGETAAIRVKIVRNTQSARQPVVHSSTTLLLEKRGSAWIVTSRTGESVT